MPIPSQPTTAISLGPASPGRSISQEFSPVGPGTAIPLGAYRRGDRAADHPINTGLPAPGQSISFSQFNGKSVVLRYPSVSGQNINAFSFANSPSRVGATRSQGYLNDGRYLANQPGFGLEYIVDGLESVGSATRTQDAFVSGANDPTAWNPTVAILIKNQGQIRGAGGTGGSFSTPITWPNPGTPGLSGGTAITAQRPIAIQNTGTVGGGGGGGGAGDSIVESTTDPKTFPPVTTFNWGGGGGGGGGAGTDVEAAPGQPGTGGAGGTGIPSTFPPAGTPSQPGQAGTSTTGGDGGQGYRSVPVQVYHPYRAGTGGAGGGRGATGAAGGAYTIPLQAEQDPDTNPPYGAGAGGAAGFYILTGPGVQVEWLQEGTRQGQAG